MTLQVILERRNNAFRKAFHSRRALRETPKCGQLMTAVINLWLFAKPGGVGTLLSWLTAVSRVLWSFGKLGGMGRFLPWFKQ